jgi:hypothetical protein
MQVLEQRTGVELIWHEYLTALRGLVEETSELSDAAWDMICTGYEFPNFRNRTETQKHLPRESLDLLIHHKAVAAMSEP